ncbi:MAG: hypothetical protein H0X30_09955 [Anaerolineae bacterium]|nr:hypothetical protein [Anaerolineae bacterium]
MFWLRLFWWVLWRGIVSGALLGAMFLYVGLFWGAVLGMAFGIVNGIALVLLTQVVSPLNHPHHYRWSALLVSVVCTTITSLLWASGIDASPELALILTVVATITATVFVWRLTVTNAVLFYIEK